MLSHEKLEAYGVSVDFFALCTADLEALPRGQGNLKDQLDRAAISILLNIAEGAGKIGTKDKARYYAIARGSAFECGAVYDALAKRDLVDPNNYRRAKWLLGRIASMLTALIGVKSINESR